MFTTLKPTIMAMMLVSASMPWAQAQAAASQIHDNACYKCHKKNGTMLGVHANDALAITCNDCHGEKGGHPRKPSSMVIFNSTQSTPQAQTDRCLACHDPEVLARHDWTHNAHSNKVDCADCHQLHPDQDPMVKIPATTRTELCRRCHQQPVEKS
ncbi:multiheme c-type cytochrome [Shewanella sp. NIFS-20-20]|uniref:multiheme c-type cytochrome n=1 Tax=Shewanella sp. NIFS-20-20 TaxID=2853806 RepID=UPI001C4753FF|nr:multiheme c-type cytochrome [Shewanella sp. NIFS-20-20]MBV7316667.1 nitrite reductase [Shewanella sp. NIFS-20-20]